MTDAEPQIAISTGWLFEADRTTFADHQPFAGAADGVELSLTSPDRVSPYEKRFPDDWYCSFHLSTGWLNCDVVSRLGELHSPQIAVVHPDAEFSQSVLDDLTRAGVPVAIENMDRRLFGGMTVDEVVALLEQYGVGLVLDVQHAYENDESMEYAREIVRRVGNCIEELHVAGESGAGESLERHELVHKAENQQAITEFLEWFYSRQSAPMVIEGHYRTVDDVEREVAYLRAVADGAL